LLCFGGPYCCCGLGEGLGGAYEGFGAEYDCLVGAGALYVGFAGALYVGLAGALYVGLAGALYEGLAGGGGGGGLYFAAGAFVVSGAL